MKRVVATMFALALLAPAAAAAEGQVPGDAKSLAELLRPKPVAKTETAAKPAATAPAVEAEPLAPMSSMIGFAVVIGALLVGGAVVVKRLRSKGIFEAAAKELAVEESLWVGRGQRLLLVSIGTERVLLGLSGSGFEGLAVLGPKSAPAPAPIAEPVQHAPIARPVPRPVDDDREFKDVMKDELAMAFKPSHHDRRKILERLNSL